MQKLTLSLLSIALLTACQSNATFPDYSSCEYDTYTIENLQALKDKQYSALPQADYAPIGQALLNCIGVADPAVRDGLVYESVTFFLRSGELSVQDYRDYRDILNGIMDEDHPDGFAHPFAALLLAEVARTDRVSPWMSEDERDEMVTRASAYLMSVNDYRGFDDEEGWRHGVAHGADWLMQLALNPAMSASQDTLMLVAIAGQVQSRNSHNYSFGEPERLARPVLFIAQRGQLSDENWQAFFDEITDKGALASWADAFKSEEDLARLYNAKNFLYVINTNANLSTDENVKPLADRALKGLRSLP